MADIKNHASLPTNLVSVWLTDNSGLTADLHGSNTLTNSGATEVAGKQGDAGDFERGEADYESITDAAQSGLDLSTAYSIAFWIKIESNPASAGDEHWIVAKSDGSTIAYALYLVKRGTGDVAIFHDFSDGTSQTHLEDWNPSTATWHWVCVTFDGSAQESKIYINNSQLGTTFSTTPTSIQNTSIAFTIGSRSAGDRNFDGLINQLCVWSKVLSAQERADLYNSGTGIPYESPSTNVTVNATVQTATFSLPASTITAVKNVSVSPSVQTLTSSQPAVTVSTATNITVTPAVQESTFSIPTSTVSTVENLTVSVSAESATFSIPSITVLAVKNVSTAPAAQTLTFSLPAFTVSTTTTATISPSVQNATFETQTPTVSTIQSPTLTPSVQTATFSIPTSSVLLGTIQTPDSQTLVFSTLSVSLLRDYVISVTAQSLTFSIPSIHLPGWQPVSRDSDQTYSDVSRSSDDSWNSTTRDSDDGWNDVTRNL